MAARFTPQGCALLPAPARGSGCHTSGMDMPARQWIVVSETARALAESPTLAEATPRMLKAICETLEWDYGGLSRIDSVAGVLQSAGTWHPPPAPPAAFPA